MFFEQALVYFISLNTRACRRLKGCVRGQNRRWLAANIEQGEISTEFAVFCCREIVKEIRIRDHFHRKYSWNHMFSDWIYVFHSCWCTMVPLPWSPTVSRGWAWHSVRSELNAFVPAHTICECTLSIIVSMNCISMIEPSMQYLSRLSFVSIYWMTWHKCTSSGAIKHWQLWRQRLFS